MMSKTVRSKSKKTGAIGTDKIEPENEKKDIIIKKINKINNN